MTQIAQMPGGKKWKRNISRFSCQMKNGTIAHKCKV